MIITIILSRLDLSHYTLCICVHLCYVFNLTYVRVLFDKLFYEC